MKHIKPNKIILPFLLILTFCLMEINAQDLNYTKLRQGSYSANYELDMAKNEIQPSTSIQPKILGKIRFLKEVNLIDNELIINYALPRLKDNQKFIVNFQAFFNGENITPNHHQLEGDFGEILSFNSNQKKITWKDLIGSIPKAKGELNIQINVELWGDLRLSFGVDCNKPPEFKLKQKWQYYTATTVGIGTIIVGEIYLKKAKDKFEIHETTNSIRLNEEAYDDYKKNLDIGRNFAYAGASILVGSLVYHLVKRNRYKKQLEIFKDNCTEQSLNIRPDITFPTVAQSGSIGLNISYQF